MSFCGDPNCQSSPTVNGTLAFGHGELDSNGYWEFPCFECKNNYKAEELAKGILRDMTYKACDKIEREGLDFKDDKVGQIIDQVASDLSFSTLLKLMVLPEISDRPINLSGHDCLFGILDTVVAAVLDEKVGQELLSRKAKKIPCQCKPRYQFYPKVNADGTFYCPDCKIVLSAKDWVETNSLSE